MKLNLPELAEVLEEIEFFERERTDRQSVGLAILLYNHGVSLRKIGRVLGWLGVDRSHVALIERGQFDSTLTLVQSTRRVARLWK